jgi:arginine deiminase
MNLEAKITAERDSLGRVVAHGPGIESFFGLLEPYGSLYDRAFIRYEARRELERLEHGLKHEFNVDLTRRIV